MAEQLSDPDVAVPSAAGDVVVVSNREPYRHEFGDDADDLVVDRPTGGLTAGLDPVMQRLGGTWIAWGDGEADFVACDDRNRVDVPPEEPGYTLQRVPLSSAEVEGYYEGYANRTLWPLCHTQMGNVRFDADEWEYYRAVNERFADVVAEQVDDDSTVWFQDYHFALAPRLVRQETDALLSQFWHVPWPAADVFRVAPHDRELLEGLLANDLLGFHVPRYCENFLECVDECLDDVVVDRAEDTVYHGDRPTRVASFPLGVDVEAVRTGAAAAPAAGENFRRRYGVDRDRPLVLGVDRLDYTKGIPERLEALEHLWETRPELREAFTYVQKGQESREGIDAYRELQSAVASRVARVNDRFGSPEWQPVVSTTEYLPSEELYGLYRDSVAALVTPLRDGMNLVAKEYVAAQTDDAGALVLSEFAGASHELDDGAYSVNPNDTEACADTIARALESSDEERRRRLRAMRSQVADGGVTAWIESVFETLDEVGRARGVGPT